MSAKLQKKARYTRQMTVARIPIALSIGKRDRKWWLENNHSTVNDITYDISAISFSKLQGDMG